MEKAADLPVVPLPSSSLPSTLRPPQSTRSHRDRIKMPLVAAVQPFAPNRCHGPRQSLWGGIADVHPNQSSFSRFQALTCKLSAQVFLLLGRNPAAKWSPLGDGAWPRPPRALHSHQPLYEGYGWSLSLNSYEALTRPRPSAGLAYIFGRCSLTCSYWANLTPLAMQT